MTKPGREYSRAYGVAIDGDHLLVVAAERTRAGVSIRTVLEQRLGPGGLDDPGRLAPVQADLLAGSAALSAAIPTGSSFTRWLETPFGSRRKALRVLPALLDIQLPFPLENCVYRFPCIEGSRAGGRVRALAVAARIPDIEEQIGRLKTLGLDPLIVEHEALAVWNLYRREYPSKATDLEVVAHLGTSRSALVLGTGDGLAAAFPLGPGVEALKQDAGNGDGTPGSAVSAFRRRVRHILRANVPDEARATRWTWTGAGADEAALTRALEAALHDEPGITFETAREPQTFLARALATDALEGSAAAGNLRSGPLEHAACAVRRGAHLRRAATSGIIAGALLCGIGLAGPWLLAHRDRQLQDEITRQAKTLTGMRAVPRGQELLIVEQKLADRRQREATILRAGSLGASHIMADAVARAGPAGVTLTGVTARPGFFSVKGVAPDRGRAQEFADELRGGGFTTALELENGADGERVVFVVKGEPGGD